MRLRNIFHLGVGLPVAKMTKGRVPFQVFIRIIEQCNLHCTYCLDDYVRENRKQATTDQWLKTIDGLARLGTRRITLFGGEPLLRNDIGVIVERIKRHKIDCSLTTNGRFIDKHVKMLKHLDQLSVSLDENKEAHDAFRGAGTWDIAIHAVQVARSHGVPVQLMSTMTKLTDHKLENLYKLAEQYDCLVDFNEVRPIFKADGSTQIRPEDPGEEKMAALLNHHIEHPNPRLAHNTSVMEYVRDWPATYSQYNLFRAEIPAGMKINSCNAGRLFAEIEPNGDLMPCCVPRPDYKPINVFELGVKKAWEKMPKNNCMTCRSLGFNNFNALFNLQPKSLKHLLGQTLRVRFRRLLSVKK